MTAGVLVALAVACLALPPPTGRLRAVVGTTTTRRGVDPGTIAWVVTPVAGLVVLGWPLGMVVGLVAAPVVRRSVAGLETAAQRRRADLLAHQLPPALDLMVAALDVGRPPVAAFALAAEASDEPLRAELALVAGRLTVTADPRAVWLALTDHDVLAPVGRAFARADDSGMPVARVVAGVAEETRRVRRARRRDRGRQVGVRTAAPLGACFLPAFFLVGIVPTVIATFHSLAW